jgi:hypothetical protein
LLQVVGLVFGDTITQPPWATMLSIFVPLKAKANDQEQDHSDRHRDGN